MNNNTILFQHATELLYKIANDVLVSANQMQGTIIAAAAFGGFCLFIYRVVEYYKSFDKDLISKEHALAIILIIIMFIALPLFGVIFVGIYGISNHVAAWQIGLTTPMLIESVYLSYAEKAKSGHYHKKFLPEQPDA